MSSYDRPARSSRREYYEEPPDDPYDRKHRRRQRSPPRSSTIDPPPFYDHTGQDAPDDDPRGGQQAPRQNPEKAEKPRPRSAMRDPDRPSRRNRSDSQVRLQEPNDGNESDGSIEGHYVRHRDGRIDFVPDEKTKRSARPRDLERKDGPDNRRFRERRNGYESDEGEQLKKERRRRPPPDDDGPGRGMPPVNGSSSYDIPDRTRSRRDPEDAGGPGAGALAAGAGGAAAAYGASRGAGRRRPPPGYEDDYEERPQPRRQQRPRSYAYDDDERHERGYDSERPRRRRSAWDDEAGYAPPSRAARLRDPRDQRDPRYDDRRRSARYDDPYDDPRYAPEYGARPRRSNTTSGRDRRPRDPREDPRAVGKHGVDMDWKGQGMELFKTHAMPVIRQEGGRMLRKQLQTFLANGAGR